MDRKHPCDEHNQNTEDIPRKQGLNSFPVSIMIVLVVWVAFTNCNSVNSREEPIKIAHIADETSHPDSVIDDKQIPVLCYHQVRDWRSTDSKNDRVFIMPVSNFKEQMEVLHDSGYNSISPDQLIEYIVRGSPLPVHPFLLSFDDATESQYINALPELNKVGFKATFFIMTVVLGHNEYMSRANVAEIAREGHVIGCHTWDHRNVTLYNENDWVTELEKPTDELEQITGKPVKYFAYPYGSWDKTAITELKKYGYIAAFQLWGKGDQKMPLYTIKRILVSGYWSPKELLSTIHKVEKQPEQS